MIRAAEPLLLWVGGVFLGIAIMTFASYLEYRREGLAQQIRDDAQQIALAGGEAVSLGQVLRELARNRSFILVVLATSVMSLSGYGVLTWGATFLMRVHGMGMVQVGVWLGLGIGITSYRLTVFDPAFITSGRKSAVGEYQDEEKNNDEQYRKGPLEGVDSEF